MRATQVYHDRTIRRQLDCEEIYRDEDTWFERHLALKHESNFFANLNPGAPVTMPATYCPECVALATALAVAA